ncbi:hypothetical protein BDZ91DRAFT_768011 [Kalaharituber pfeilii]|nr:hypothetical protein BDZ91DRAFT_768011 [Kalaharituber pfeilii]
MEKRKYNPYVLPKRPIYPSQEKSEELVSEDPNSTGEINCHIIITENPDAASPYTVHARVQLPSGQVLKGRGRYDSRVGTNPAGNGEGTITYPSVDELRSTDSVTFTVDASGTAITAQFGRGGNPTGVIFSGTWDGASDASGEGLIEWLAEVKA